MSVLRPILLEGTSTSSVSKRLGVMFLDFKARHAPRFQYVTVASVLLRALEVTDGVLLVSLDLLLRRYTGMEGVPVSGVKFPFFRNGDFSLEVILNPFSHRYFRNSGDNHCFLYTLTEF